ncbi:anionic trypsin-like [Topomyia yanbarensis]|uniref:anionic trypsin-like n=1 Tax=Topomyia yanbarensis TaxID=2498891 RepID=UPI00273C3B24|nr:anionic trypsin-like [Topomyia yanbarensis]
MFSCVVSAQQLLVKSILFSLLANELALGRPIVNGLVPEYLEQFHFAVSLQRTEDAAGGTNRTHFCGGTYIGDGWIVTANHCITSFSSENDTIITYIGGHQLNGTDHWRVFSIDKTISNPSYNRYTLDGDIALLHVDVTTSDGHFLDSLDEMIEGTLLLPTRSLAGGGVFDSNVLNLIGDREEEHENEYGSEECHIYGYGSATFYGPGSNLLQYGPVQPLGHRECREMLGPVVAPAAANSGMFCAIGLADACKGDSGGGLVCRRRLTGPSEVESFDNARPYTLRGVISYGAGCGLPASPGVYADVGFYWDWIQEQILMTSQSNIVSSK